MRLDRFITLSLVHPVRRLLNHSPFAIRHSPCPIPILMYHSITDDPEPGVSLYYKVNTSPARFREHMRFLADHGYKTISLSDLVAALHSPVAADHSQTAIQNSPPSVPHPPSSVHQSPFTSRQVVLTFDDGFRNFYTEAFPAMQKHGFTATVFLPTAFIGDNRRRFTPAGGCRSPIRHSPVTIHPASSRQSPVASRPHEDCLTWNEVRELHAAGISIGSHTVNHPKLVDLPWPEIERELRDSKRITEDRLQSSVTQFAYPYAFPQTNKAFVEQFVALLNECGYTSCATTQIGRMRLGNPAPSAAVGSRATTSAFSLQPSAFLLKRLPANGADDPSLFAGKLAGDYDWLARPQTLAKRLKCSIVSSRHLPVAIRQSPVSVLC